MPPAARSLLSTGIPGLDDVLAGGLPRDRLYLVSGDPGVGKTTLALQFLVEGARAGERGLYITLSETKAEIQAVAESHGLSLDGIELFELTAAQQLLKLDEQNTLFEPSEVDLQEATRILLDEIQRVDAARVVVDSLSELRLLSQSSLRFRRQILLLKQFFAGRSATVLLLDDRTGEGGDVQLESLAHGVIRLELRSPDYGRARRRLCVTKLRGVSYRTGYHDCDVRTGGMWVYPRLVAAEHSTSFHVDTVPSGVESLDELLGGGIERGTCTLLLGPTGTGKSALATQYAMAAAARGERAAFFVFDERLGTLFARARALGMDLQGQVAAGAISVQQIDPAELSPGEFVRAIRDAVDAGARVVVIDSLNGYLYAMPDERFLAVQMHELLSYLAQVGVTTVLTMVQHGMLGQTMTTPVDVSYLADTVLLLRYFEAGGAVHKAISVVKKRTGQHESTIRDFSFGADGVRVGRPLSDFRGLLTGTPSYVGRAENLLTDDASQADGHGDADAR